MVDRGRGISALRTSDRDFPGGQPKKNKNKNKKPLSSMVLAINTILYTYDFAKRVDLLLSVLITNTQIISKKAMRKPLKEWVSLWRRLW